MVHISGLLILTWQLNRPSDIHHSRGACAGLDPVAGTQWSQGLFWIPALRSGRNDEFSCRINVLISVQILSLGLEGSDKALT